MQCERMEAATSLADLPIAVLDEVVLALEHPDDRQALRGVCRATRQAVNRYCTLLLVNSDSLRSASCSVLVERYPATQRVVLTLRLAQNEPDQQHTLTQLLNSFPRLQSLDLSLYATHPGPDAVHQVVALLSALPRQLCTISVDVHVKLTSNVQMTELACNLRSLVCQALGAGWASTQTGNEALSLSFAPLSFTPQDIQHLGDDLSCLTRLVGISLKLHDGVAFLGKLPALVHLHLACLYASQEDGTGYKTDAEVLAETALGGVLASLQHLAHLRLADYQGDLVTLLQELASLPGLAHLGLPGEALASRRISDAHLQPLSMMPALTSLEVDRLVLSLDSPELPGILSLQVGLSVSGEERLPRVFPNVQVAQFNWMWESALLKMAGWRAMRQLTLAQLGFVHDWRLLVTLRESLEELHLAHGSGAGMLRTLLDTAQELPLLRCLSLAFFDMSIGPAPAPWSEEENALYIAGLQSVGGVPQLDKTTDIADALSRLVGLVRLELTACAPDILHYVCACAQQGGLRSLRELRLSQAASLNVRLLQQLVDDLPGLRRLELGACYVCAGQSLGHLNTPRHVQVYMDANEIAAFG